MTTLVTAGTGQVGRAVVSDLLRRHEPVRVLTRNAASARQLLGDGPELVAGELTDRSVRRAAFKDVTRLFLGMGNHVGQVAAECAAIAEARAAGVERIVKLSGPAPSPDALLVAERWHAEIEDRLWSSGTAAVALRPTAYTTNLLAFAATVAREGVLRAPVEGARVAFVDPRDVGSVGAALLMASSLPAERVLRLTGPAAVTYHQVADAIGDVLGAPVRFEPVSEEDARGALVEDALPGPLVETLLTVYRLQRSGAFADVTTVIADLLGRPARGVREVVAEHGRMFDGSAMRLTPQRS